MISALRSLSVLMGVFLSFVIISDSPFRISGKMSIHMGRTDAGAAHCFLALGGHYAAGQYLGV